MIELAVQLLRVCFALIAIHYFWKSLSDPAWLVEMAQPSKGDMDVRSVSVRNHAKRWIDRKRYAYIAAAIVGASIMTYWIAKGALVFLPEVWGTNDEDGDFSSYRRRLSILFDAIGGVGLPTVFLSYAKRRLQETEKQ